MFMEFPLIMPVPPCLILLERCCSPSLLYLHPSTPKALVPKICRLHSMIVFVVFSVHTSGADPGSERITVGLQLPMA